MLKIHTRSGKTLRFDMADAGQAKELLSALKLRDFQESITGISVVQDAATRARCTHCDKAQLVCGCCGADNSSLRTRVGVQYSLSRPDESGPVSYAVEDVVGERGGERVVCFAGDSKITMMVHRGQPSVRVSLSQPGSRRYSP